MRAIILAAGQGFQLDGCVKLLIRDPLTNKRIIDNLIDIFGKNNITIVVWYKAIEIIQKYPFIDYVFNSEWQVTNNSYSLFLALDERPCYVLSSDLIVSSDIINKLDDSLENVLLTANKENREPNSLNCRLIKNNIIDHIYQGPRLNKNDPESLGVFKITNKKILNKWKKSCFKHNNLFAGQNLPFDIETIYSVNKGNFRFDEINTVMDMLNIIKNKK